jgi:hypothetical protein
LAFYQNYHGNIEASVSHKQTILDGDEWRFCMDTRDESFWFDLLSARRSTIASTRMPDEIGQAYLNMRTELKDEQCTGKATVSRLKALLAEVVDAITRYRQPANDLWPEYWQSHSATLLTLDNAIAAAQSELQ